MSFMADLVKCSWEAIDQELVAATADHGLSQKSNGRLLWDQFALLHDALQLQTQR